MDLSKIAMPIHKLFERAIVDHKRTHYCDLPKCFVVHPEVLAKLKLEAPRYVWDPTTLDPIFFGVHIKQDVKATEPKLIASTNEEILL
jgi:hypothetical protein